MRDTGRMNPRIDRDDEGLPVGGAARSGSLGAWMPGLRVLATYRREWLHSDLLASLVLTAMLIPVGMGYAQASGLPPIHGLYATIVPLIVYAFFGPSRIMVLGPDSTLAAVIAAVILPLAGDSIDKAVALAGMLAILTGVGQILIGFLRLGMMADLFSKPVRIGFMNAIALTVIVGQLPKLFGFSVKADTFLGKVQGLANAFVDGPVNGVALALGGGSLALMLAVKQWRPTWPGVLAAVVLGTALVAGLGLASRFGVAVIGEMPRGLPVFTLPLVPWNEFAQLIPGAAMIALLSFADTSVLSRALAAKGRYRVSQDQEMLALGVANVASGLFQGFSVSSSSSRTPVASSAGSRTQLTGLVAAVAIAALLIMAPGLLRHLPEAVLGAVVIAACLGFADVPGMLALHRQRRIEFLLSLVAFLGVALIGVIEGIVITILLSLLVLVWNAWHPYFATLVRVDGRKGYHDALRHPEGRPVPGLVIFRWDAELFFANAEIFRQQVFRAVDRAATPVRWVLVAAEAITDIDITASELLTELREDLDERGIELHFAGLKGPVKDRLAHYGHTHLGAERLWPTVGSAVQGFRDRFVIDWKDWDET